MIKVHAKLDCGCCTTDMRFNSIESATEAFRKAGLGNGISIKDDAGVVHEGIDTFYGFSEDEEEQGNRSLGYLAEQVNKVL
jgi:hypothetical protein